MNSNPQLDLAFQYAQYTHRNVFLTGKAGTGKTTFLRNLRKQTRKRMIVVAPTGVAAINAGGVTIHSFFQLAPGLFLPGQTVQRKDAKMRYGFSKHKINILRSLDLLVIDEISMVRCDLLDAIDDVLRRYQNRHKPFGGVQLLMIGDLQQLAPVATDQEWTLLKPFYNTPYFFDSLALRQTSFTTIELTHVYRQADQTFIDILNNVRDNHLDAQTLAVLNSRYQPGFRPADKDGYITLTTHNYQAQEINQNKLLLLKGDPITYTAKIKGDFPETSYPTDAELTLKVGAQVMFCKNDSSGKHQYYNGKIGRVIYISANEVMVESTGEDGMPQDIPVQAEEWSNTKYVTDEKSGEITEEVTGSFTQIPLRTAWAITIHKSQGLTFDRCIINAGRAFSFGQVYVALSRCRTLEGLVLTTPITPNVVMSDPNILRFNQAAEQNQPDEQQLQRDRLQCIDETLCSIFDYQPMLTQLRYVLRIADEHLPKSQKTYVDGLKDLTVQCEEQLENVGIRFQHQIHQLIAQAPDYESNTLLQERFQKGNAYFFLKTTELLNEFICTGLPAIENKRTKEQLEREFELLKSQYDLKILLLMKTKDGFSLDAYWNAKALSTMQDSAEYQPDYAGKPKSGKAKAPRKSSKPGSKTTTKKNKKTNLSNYE
ncbi:MAG: AAA family ATPase [Bacteroidales bacterium]|nr:AAA family ATPase [Bacteroidales bacterium]